MQMVLFGTSLIGADHVTRGAVYFFSKDEPPIILEKAIKYVWLNEKFQLEELDLHVTFGDLELDLVFIFRLSDNLVPDDALNTVPSSLL